MIFWRMLVTKRFLLPIGYYYKGGKKYWEIIFHRSKSEWYEGKLYQNLHFWINVLKFNNEIIAKVII